MRVKAMTRSHKTFAKTLASVALIAGGAFAALAASQTMAGSDTARDRGDGARRACVSAPLDDTRILDDSTLLVTDYHGNAALIKMNGRCLEKNEAIGIKYYGSNQICGPVDVEITGSVATNIPIPCFIDSVTPISKDEAKAYLAAR